MERVVDKPVLVIAGPGAGKTFNMVGEIAQVVSDLRPNRVLAAITYTNAATEMIRNELGKVTQLPPNIFVSTNHSFFNRFILLPYATLFGHVAADKLFLDVDIDALINKRLDPKKRTDFRLRNWTYSQVVNDLLRKGKVPFEQIVKVSAELMQDKRIRDIVCNRLQYLFIDEFQDTDTYQLAIFDAIRKCQRTRIYAVGDPEQYILSFTYRGRKAPQFDKIPFKQFSAQKCVRDENRRSYSAIVEFTNHFHTEITQKALKGGDEHCHVYFLTGTDLGGMITKFRELAQVLEDKAEHPTKFYIAKENKTFDDCAAQYGLIPVSNDRFKPRSLLDEALKLISAITGLSQKQICDRCKLDQIDYRRLGIKLLRAMQAGTIKDIAQAVSFIEDTLILRPGDEAENVTVQFQRLWSLIYSNKASSNEQHGSIHKVKGLEADAVLVVARTENELQKWLTTDKAERGKDTSDTCRIGYVAFTRAKRILCIACKHVISDDLKGKLVQLGVSLI